MVVITASLICNGHTMLGVTIVRGTRVVMMLMITGVDMVKGCMHIGLVMTTLAG
jgi:hypothetical protein